MNQSHFKQLAAAVLTALFLAGCGGGSSPPAAQTPPPLAAVSTDPAGSRQTAHPAVDEYLQKMIKDNQIPAVSIAVMENGTVIYAKSYGYANLESALPAKPEDRFQIGSISKSFAAVAVMLLVEEGKMNLDATIGTYLGAVPPALAPITVRQLLTHTSGMQENPDEAARRLLDLPNLLTEMEMADYFMKMPLARAPGASWAYSNIAYDLVGVIIGKASGKYYGDFLSERIFVPLQMRDTRIIQPYDKPAGTATGYTRTAGRVVPEPQSPALRNYLSMAAGGIESTVLDMAKFDAALARGTLLSAASRDQIVAPSALVRAAAPGVTEAHYGFGWFITNDNNHRLLAHSGGMPGYIADFVRYPDAGISVLLLTNQGFSGGPPQTASRALARMFRPALP